MSAKVLIAHVYQKPDSLQEGGGAFPALKVLPAQLLRRTRPG